MAKDCDVRIPCSTNSRVMEKLQASAQPWDASQSTGLFLQQHTKRSSSAQNAASH